MKIINRVLKYPGSKWNLVPKILERIPEHHTYVEPFFGSGAVLFSKAHSDIEMINDMDHNVCNLFECIKNDSPRLARMIMSTPYSREVYDKAYEEQGSDPFDLALQFITRCWQGYGFRTNDYKVGWKNDVQGRERMYALWDWYRLPEKIIEVAERLRTVQIENRPAIEVIERFNFDNVFMYLDPPYVLGTRTAKQYKHEMTDQDHEQLLRILLKSNANIMISGYETELYNDYLQRWNKSNFNACAEFGLARTETIWFNYDVGQITLDKLLV